MLFLGKIKKMVKAQFEKSNHPERYKHTLGVVKMAKFLAKRYHISTKKAMLAAYLHDYCKYEATQELQMLLKEEDKLECQEYPVLYHSYSSAEFYKREIGKDEEIYQAIRNHVFGRIGMSRLEEIVLISDYTEENRTYPNCIRCREILLSGNLNLAIFESTKSTIEFLKAQGIKPHPLQLEVYHYYEGRCKNDIK